MDMATIEYFSNTMQPGDQRRFSLDREISLEMVKAGFGARDGWINQRFREEGLRKILYYRIQSTGDRRVLIVTCKSTRKTK